MRSLSTQSKFSVKQLKLGVEVNGLKLETQDQELHSQLRGLLKEKKVLFVKNMFGDLANGGQHAPVTTMLQTMQDLANGIAGDEIDASVLKLTPFAASDPSCTKNFPRIRALGIVQDNQESQSAAGSAQKTQRQAERETCCCFAWWRSCTNKKRQAGKGKLANGGQELESFLRDAGIEEPENTSTRGMEWHTDGPGITILYAHILPKTLTRRTWFVDSHKLLTALGKDQQAVARRLRQVVGPDRTMEASVGDALEKGARMNELGTRLERPIPASWLTTEQLKAREKGWEGSAKRWSHLQGSLVKRNMSGVDQHGSSADVVFVNPMHLVRFEEPELSEAAEVFHLKGKAHSNNGKSEGGKNKDESMKEESGELSSAVIAAILEPGIKQHAHAHYWEAGDAAIFDNRQLMHSADNLQSACEPHLMLQIYVKCMTAMTSP